MTDWPPRDEQPRDEQLRDEEPRDEQPRDEAVAPDPDTPTVTTEPTEWFEPPAVEVESSDAPLPPEEPFASEAVDAPEVGETPAWHAPPVPAAAPLRTHADEVLTDPVVPDASSAPEPVEPDAETPTVTTEPTDWLNPPLVEPVPEAAVPEYLHPPSTGHVGAAAAYGAGRAYEEVAFSLAGFDSDQRQHLMRRLLEANVACRLEEGTLFGRIDDAGLIEGYIADLSGSEDIEEVIEDADEVDDEIVFDLSSLSAEERRHLSMRLTGANITHIWEVATDLVVSVKDAQVIETYVEEVRNPDGFGDEEIAAFDEDADVDDEAIYSAMSNLYVAADKLMQKPADEALAGNFYLAADDVEGLPAPFGFDPRVWSQVLALTESIVAALDDEGDPEAIGSDAANLRQLLVNYV